MVLSVSRPAEKVKVKVCWLHPGTMAMTGQSSCSSMSNHTKDRVTMAKVTLENFYSNLIAQHEEREMR